MRKIISFLAAALLSMLTQTLVAQAKKPTLMIIPSEIYCIEKGYFQEIEDQGQKLKVPDYTTAFQKDADLRAIISNVNNYMTDQGFPLKDMEAEMKNMAIEDTEEKELTDKAGNELKESRLDKLKRRSKADIVLDLYFAIKKNGAEKTMTFNLKGLDAYTSYNIAGVEKAGTPSAGKGIEVLLREDIYPNMTEFNDRLQRHFETMFKEGREVSIVIRLAEDAPIDFETEFNGQEFSEVIDDWFQVNTVSGRYTVGDISDVRMPITAKIPIYDQNNKAIDTRQFAQQLRKFLKDPPYNLTCKVSPRGLGQAYIIIGSAKD